MNYAKKYYLLDPALYQRVMLNSMKGDDDAATSYKKFVTTFGKSKIEDRNLTDENWKKFGEKYKNYLGPTNVPGTIPSAGPAATTTSTSVGSTASSDIIKLLETKIAKNKRAEAVRLFVLLKKSLKYLSPQVNYLWTILKL